MEVHAALRHAGRARREGDDRDVVGRGVDRLEGPARRQVLEQRASRSHVAPRPPGRARRARAHAAPSRPPSRSRRPAAAASSRPRSRRRAGCRATRRSPPAVLGECSSTRVPGSIASVAATASARDRAARRRTPAAAIAVPSCAQQLDRGVQPLRIRRAAAGRATPRAAGSRSRANVSISRAPPRRSSAPAASGFVNMTSWLPGICTSRYRPSRLENRGCQPHSPGGIAMSSVQFR